MARHLLRATLVAVALMRGCEAQGYGGNGGAYEQELRRRQMEYAQAQALRQQQAQVSAPPTRAEQAAKRALVCARAPPTEQAAVRALAHR